MTVYFGIEEHETQADHQLTETYEDIPGVPTEYRRIESTEPSTLTPQDPKSRTGWNHRDSMAIVAAEPDEAVEWSAKERLFAKAIEEAADAVRAAEEAFHRRVAEIHADCVAAWKVYEPVHDILGERAKELEAVYDIHAAEREEQDRIEAQARRLQQEKEHGPRIFLVYKRSDDGGAVGGRAMNQATIHVEGCTVAERSRQARGLSASSWQPVHADQAILELVSGVAQRKSTRRYRYTEWVIDEKAPLLEAKVCKRCHADEKLAEFDPQTYANWKRRTDEAQPPRLTDGAVDTLVRRLTRKTSGTLDSSWWCPVSDTDEQRHRNESGVLNHEVLIGIACKDDNNRNILRNLTDDLVTLGTATLADFGYAARRPIAPHYGRVNVSEKPSPHFLAVRKMTGVEYEKHKAEKKAAR